MKKYFGEYWILSFIITGLAIYLAKYWYKTATNCQKEHDAMMNPIDINNPSGKPLW